MLPDHDDGGPGWAWGAMIMPFIEEAALHDQIDFSVSLRERRNRSRCAALRCRCSSARRTTIFEPIIDIPSKSSTRIICQMAAGNYVASAGTIRPTCKLCRDQFDGVFGRNRAHQAEGAAGRPFEDACGRRAGQSSWSRPAIWGVLPNSKILDNQKPGLYAAGPAYVLGTTFNEGFNIETSLDEMDHGTMGTFAESFGSEHPGGAFFLFCDASVRFVYDDADPVDHERPLDARRQSALRRRADHSREPVLDGRYMPGHLAPVRRAMPAGSCSLDAGYEMRRPGAATSSDRRRSRTKESLAGSGTVEPPRPDPAPVWTWPK